MCSYRSVGGEKKQVKQALDVELRTYEKTEINSITVASNPYIDLVWWGHTAGNVGGCFLECETENREKWIFLWKNITCVNPLSLPVKDLGVKGSL